MVTAAIREANLSHLPLHVVPFPRNEHLLRFQAEMAEIIPKLPSV